MRVSVSGVRARLSHPRRGNLRAFARARFRTGFGARPLALSRAFRALRALFAGAAAAVIAGALVFAALLHPEPARAAGGPAAYAPGLTGAALPGADLPGPGMALQPDPAGGASAFAPGGFPGAGIGSGQPQGRSRNGQVPADTGWRIRILEAAVVNGPMVTLGEIGQVHGAPPPGVWERLANRPLWPAPAEPGKPLQVNRTRLSQALREALGDVADRCLLPTSMAIQSGGAVLREDDLRALVVRELTPRLRALPGDAELEDFRLPTYAFLAHPGQRIALETGRIGPGRLPLRFVALEVDGTPIRRFTGTVMVNLWADVPCAAQPLNRGDRVGPEQVTWIRKNLTFVRGDLWDGRGGPWEARKAVGTGQPILISDLGPVTAVRRGAVVNLVYARGAVRLVVKAEALADGGTGDTVPVRNLQTKKQVYAEIVDADTVQVK